MSQFTRDVLEQTPRIAVGTIQSQTRSQAIQWGLLDYLERLEMRVQCFRSRCCLAEPDGATVITGRAPRYLDTWLIDADQTRQMFLRGSQGVDLAVLDGSFAPVRAGDRGGDLHTLCDWLASTRLAMVDVSKLQKCVLPARPQVDAILLDRVSGADFFRAQTQLEALWGIPVIGGMADSARLSEAADRLPPGDRPSRELCAALGLQFARWTSAERLLSLFSSRELPPVAPLPWYYGGLAHSKISVSIAYDEAFSGYFPATLELLEELGVRVRDFSPLHDEALPPGTDIVYCGGGQPERFAEQLSQNHCMLLALREHQCAGRRLYAEGGGLGYLSQILESEGRRYGMVGAIPAIARHNPECTTPEPVEVTLARDTWLGSAGLRLKGYLNRAWSLEPTGSVVPYSLERDRRLDLIGRHQAIGSRIHFNFAAQPACLRQFVQPHPEAIAWAAAT